MKIINNNLAFYLIALFGILAILIGIILILDHSLITVLGIYKFVVLLLNILFPTIVIYWCLSLTRLYLESGFLIVKRGLKGYDKISLRDIRRVKRISAFPLAFSYSDLICRYKIEFVNFEGDLKAITFFDTMSDKKDMRKFLEAVREENPFFKYDI